MIKNPYRNLEAAGFLFICLIIVALSAVRFAPSPSEPTAGEPLKKGVYIQLGGDVSLKGTYFFNHPPDLAEILPHSIKTKLSEKVTLQYNQYPPVSHSMIEITKNNKAWELSYREIPAYQKLTLGILISINQETEEGLTALPGIGPQTARILIRERQKRGGFKDLNELKSLPGIGKGTLRKIKPFLTL
jgi:competence ComEA-like helix-hairpin-helix protein